MCWIPTNKEHIAVAKVAQRDIPIIKIGYKQQIRRLEAELSHFKSSTSKDDKDGIELLKQLNKKKSNRDGYSLFLHHCGLSKLRVVKIIMNHVTHDLREAKALADKAPCIIAKNLSEDEANLIHNALTNEGAAVSVEC